jgi:hypothetical protein
VTYSPALRWLIAILVPLTFGWKLAAGQPYEDASREDLIAFLNRHDFTVAEQTSIEQIPVLRAERGACRLLIVEASAQGWSQQLFLEASKSMDRRFFVFRGSVYAEQPTLLTTTVDWWSSYLRKLHLSRQQSPVIGVAAAGDCPADTLPWADLGQP